ncbi:G-protein coupled receptor family C group 6 member A-like [Diretmus argenteus]
MVPPFRSYSAEERLRCVSAPGDIIIGGLFPIHGQTNRTTVPGPVSCTNYDLQMFLRAQVMIFAIEEINQRSPRILPNLMIGYEIYDTCGDVTFAMGATLKLLMAKSDGQSYFLPGPKHPDTDPLTVPEAHVKVVIGERYSEVSIAVARLFALSSVAQISYGSTSELLSRKLKFPTFLRTLSSDTHQTKAIATLVKQFNWQIVAIVGSDDEYGKYGSERLFDNLDEMNVCIEFKEILPSYFEFNQTKTHHKLSKLMKQLKQSSAEAVVLFTKTVNIAIIMEAAIQQNLNRTWIASDTWSTSQRISEMPGIQKAGRVFGFISRRNEVPGFKDYVTSKLSKTTNPFLQHHWIHYPPCPSEMNSVTNCSLSQPESKKCLHPSCLVEYTDQDESYNVYLAVKVVAEGLRRLLKCDSKKCERDANFTALELLMAIKQVNFTVNSTRIFFDDNGDPSIGYDIVQWNMTESTQRIRTIGE